MHKVILTLMFFVLSGFTPSLYAESYRRFVGVNGDSIEFTIELGMV